MMITDFCKNSITLTPEEKNYANNTYNNFFSALKQSIPEDKLELNIYLGGSVALREPSLYFEREVVKGINSDLDLFVVVRNMDIAPYIISTFRKIEHIEKNLERSFHLILFEKIPDNLCLATLDDILYAADQPIIQRFPTGEVPRLIRQERTIGQLFVHLCCLAALPYYLSGHIYSNKSNVHLKNKKSYLKMILNGLRLQFYGVIDNAHGFRSIHDLLQTGIFDAILPRETIESFLICRERYQENHKIPCINPFNFIVNAWAKKLNISTYSSMPELITAARKVLTGGNALHDNLSLMLLTYSLYAWNPNNALQEILVHYANVIIDTDDELPVGLLATLQSIIAALTNSPKINDELTLHFTELMNHSLKIFGAQAGARLLSHGSGAQTI